MPNADTRTHTMLTRFIALADLADEAVPGERLGTEALKALRAELPELMALPAAMADAEKWPDWPIDVEAVGIVVAFDANPTGPDMQLGARAQALGDTGHGWRPDAMLRAIWASANEQTRSLLDGLNLRSYTRDMLTGDVVTL